MPTKKQIKDWLAGKGTPPWKKEPKYGPSPFLDGRKVVKLAEDMSKFSTAATVLKRKKVTNLPEAISRFTTAVREAGITAAEMSKAMKTMLNEGMQDAD